MRTEKCQVMLTGEEIAAVDEWRFRNRLPTRSAAVRELMRRGLRPESSASAPQRNARSTAYGIIEAAPLGDAAVTSD